MVHVPEAPEEAQPVPPAPDQDSIVVTITYADGSLATIQYLAHGSSQVPKERVEACASGITAILDNYRQTTFHGTTARAVGGRQDKGFDGELAAFVAAARQGGDWPIPFPSLVRTTRVTFAVLESLRQGTPVAIA